MYDDYVGKLYEDCGLVTIVTRLGTPALSHGSLGVSILLIQFIVVHWMSQK